MMGGEWRFGDVRKSFNRGFILRKQSAAKNKSSWLLRYEVKRGARVCKLTGSTSNDIKICTRLTLSIKLINIKLTRIGDIKLSI